jgi:hypothetical protein
MASRVAYMPRLMLAAVVVVAVTGSCNCAGYYTAMVERMHGGTLVGFRKLVRQFAFALSLFSFV